MGEEVSLKGLSSHRGRADVQPSGSGRTDGDGGAADVRGLRVPQSEL